MQDNMAALSTIVKTLHEHGVNVVFFTPPYWPTYLRETPPEYMAATKAAMVQLKKQYGVEHYDLSADGYFYKHPEPFINSDHLDTRNRKAVAAFNKRLRKSMNQN